MSEFLSRECFTLQDYTISDVLIDPALKDSRVFVCSTVVITFWLIRIFNFRGLKTGKLMADELHLPFLIVAMALMTIVGNFGGVHVWLVGPIKMLLESTREGVFPEFFTRLNAHGMPQNALRLMATVTYFLPYLVMFAAFLRLRTVCADVPRPYRIPGGAAGAWLGTLIGGGTVLLGIVLSFVPSEPPASTAAFLFNELGIGMGPLVFGILGWLIFRRYEQRKAATVP